MIKKVPIPIAGLMLALAATGNLVLSYGNIYRNIFGILSAMVMVLLVIKVVTNPKSLGEGFENPVIASVMPTFSMGLMILSTYIKPFQPSLAMGVWFFAIIMHIGLILLFTKKYIFQYNIKKVFPSYFIVYVGIVSASVTAPAFGLPQWGQYIFWFGFISYLLLLPLVIYRVLIIKEMPEPTMPTIAIFAAPASLCLAGYLNSFQEKNMTIIGFLAILSTLMFLVVMANMVKLLKLKFYPSYSAFTFPFVITAIGIKGTNGFLANMGMAIPALKYFVKFLEAWAVVMVIYVLVRYLQFLLSSDSVAASQKPSNSN